MMNKIKIKQYGLQRSGTNLTRLLLANNFNAEILINFGGHKHGTYEIVKKTGKEFDVIITVKHPLPWLYSAYCYFRKLDKNITTFENYILKGNAIKKYNELNEHWYRIKMHNHKRVFTKIEDLMRTPKKECLKIAKHFNLKRTSKSFKYPEKRFNSRGQATNQDFKEREWRSQYNFKTFEFVRKRINKELLDKLHYKFPGCFVEMRVNTKDWWELKAHKYINKKDDRDRPDEFKRAVQKIKGNTVLEIGCAFGRMIKYIPNDIKYTGIDISKTLIAKARENYPTVDFIEDDILKIDGHWDKRFDTVMAFQVLEHFDKETFHKLMQKIKNIAKHNLIFSVPRGMPSESAENNDGHLIGWEDEIDLGMELGKYGKVKYFKGADNHICGEVIWE